MARMNGHSFPPPVDVKTATLHYLKPARDRIAGGAGGSAANHIETPTPRALYRTLTPAELDAERQIERLIERAERLTEAELDECIRRSRQAYEDAAVHAHAHTQANTHAPRNEAPALPCPPCTGNCEQGDACPVRLAEQRAQAWESAHPWLWLVYAAGIVITIAATLAASYAWPWGWALGWAAP